MAARVVVGALLLACQCASSLELRVASDIAQAWSWGFKPRSLAAPSTGSRLSAGLRPSAGSSLSRTAVIEHPEQPCQCLNFKHTYDSGLAWCGEALDVEKVEWGCDWFAAGFAGPLKKGIVGVGKNTLKMNHSYCINHDWSREMKQEGSWCYVSSSCQQLNGGKPVNQRVSWRKCVEGIDVRLADLPPAQLFALAHKHGVDPQNMVNLAYPWVGPSKGQGDLERLPLPFLQRTHKPVLGTSSKPDTDIVRYENEVW
eukprot:CAMPEP_0171097496 /NCGR_PEP_ID=MMETSP0766_2-20121228/47579_1 /TAXON_ID=439317 /ORGANISM="Gambierdiscus australes, Strain CAWD 149" /LENGTH=255 /DNA_ID=CAMNT_0011556701 /DNA_START=59 /DNA_END=823 /DNA_ORIENTATION=-